METPKPQDDPFIEMLKKNKEKQFWDSYTRFLANLK